MNSSIFDLELPATTSSDVATSASVVTSTPAHNGRPQVVARRCMLLEDDEGEESQVVLLPRFSSPTPHHGGMGVFGVGVGAGVGVVVGGERESSDEALFLACSPPRRSNNPAVPSTPTSSLMLPEGVSSYSDTGLVGIGAGMTMMGGSISAVGTPSSSFAYSASGIAPSPASSSSSSVSSSLGVSGLSGLSGLSSTGMGSAMGMGMGMGMAMGMAMGMGGSSSSTVLSASFNTRRLIKPVQTEALGAELGLLSLSPPKGSRFKLF
eukprot:TRINITY_DN2297_c1_g1_i1.p1 TRINITY_DN2297_c1_g1~~TRINITY_DN2297_c1_g1_i1.p1  ORF type:complete len:281 (-),score=60.77 TRINITY_DN2297_c1_g1_i1:83-877(-)